MKVLAAIVLLVAASNAAVVKRAAQQIPGVWDALAQLKGSSHRELTVDQIQELFVTAKAGEDFPILSEIPASNINCESDFKQPGFYADESSKCQVFHRCDVNHNLTHFLCPNMTLFNQITLVCDWWYNVDCSQAKSFQDYSNVRLYQGADVPLLDNQDVAASTGAVAVVSVGSSKKKGSKKAKRAAAQIPGVWDALAQLKGSSHRELTVDQIQELFVTAKAGEDFPILSEIPASNINCESDFKQPGFYADESSKCQVFHRCDVNHNLTHFLCPNMTLFNQITLVCDWWYNVDCSQAKSFQDYSNVRLYQGADVPLLDNQDVAASTGAVAVVSVGSSKKKGSKKAKRAAAQIPGVWDALAQLKGSSHRELTVDQIQELFVTAKAGEDFPILSEIPASNINCESDFKQAGFYADESSKCQVFHRCDVNHNLTHFLCPNMTLFNQITLVCDWWYNVDCSQAKSFQDYSNVRLYQGADVPLLDNQDVAATTGAVAVVEESKGKKGKGKGKGKNN